jgi:hypothetical protein
MTDFESTKAEFEAELKRLITKRAHDSKHNLLDDWIEALSPTGITNLRFSFDPRELHDDYAKDEIVFSKRFSFYDADYLRQCCSPGDDCLAGKHCVPIGGVDFADEFIYISDNLKLGIAQLHRDDVFSALDLDREVAKRASRLKVSLPRFLKILVPLTNLAILTVNRDASKWLVVENLGTKVRYQMHLPGKEDEGERSFLSSSESEAFFFRLIQQGRATASLSIMYCPEHLQQRIEEILNSC